MIASIDSCSCTLPISALISHDETINARKLSGNSSLDKRRLPLSSGDFRDMLAASVQLSRNTGEHPVLKPFPVEGWGHIFCREGDKGSRPHVPPVRSNYLGADISVNKKMREQIMGEVRSSIGGHIKSLRKGRGLTQIQLAQLLGVRQSAVARWEAGKDRPLPQTLLKLSELSSEGDRQWWRDQAAELAGFAENNALPSVPIHRTIPLIKTHNKVGTLGAVNPLDVALNLTLPAEWFPETGTGAVRAVRINGSSISPLVEGSYIAIIDISRRDADRLVGCMVAINTPQGIDVRWLRKDGETYLLIPLRESSDHPTRVLRHRGENSIVGQVVKWIGDAPMPKNQSYKN